MEELLSKEGRQRCEIRSATVGFGVFATEAIPAGATAVTLPPIFGDRPGRHTIQIDDRRHQAFTDDIDDFVNHSCRPTTYLDPDQLGLVALRLIAPGEEITFNYAASEWDMTDPFECRCDGTARIIRGFRHLSLPERRQLEHLVPAWLRPHLPPA
jgi:hypothetical protein